MHEAHATGILANMSRDYSALATGFARNLGPNSAEAQRRRPRVMASGGGWLRALVLLVFTGTAAAAPDVVLEGLDGEKHHLREYVGVGKWTVLNVWGPRCPPCLDEMPELVSFHEAHAEDSAMVVGMALDFPSFGYAKREEVETFVDENFVSFPNLLGDADLFLKLGVGALRGVPTSLIYTPEGELAAVHVGTLTQALIEQFIARQPSQ